MNIRDAILKAADWIERHPTQFDFQSYQIPKCGAPGCALGWIGAFAGCSAETVEFSPDSPVHRLNIGSAELFYRRMDALEDGKPIGIIPRSVQWKSDATVCARIMRLYANTYHPAIAPDWNAIATSARIPDEAPA